MAGIASSSVIGFDDNWAKLQTRAMSKAKGSLWEKVFKWCTLGDSNSLSMVTVINGTVFQRVYGRVLSFPHIVIIYPIPYPKSVIHSLSNEYID